MAINFLNTVDLNQNQLIKAAIQNLAANPASGVEGQIYFNTVAQTIKVYKEILPSTSPKTYEWASISGDITEVQGGTYINVTNQTGPIPIVNHDTTTRTNNSSAVSPAYGATFTALDSITTNTTGHVTEVNTKTVTLPASVNTTYDLTTGPAGTTTIRLTDSDSVNDDVTISGTTGQTAISRIDASELRVKLTDSVTISNNLTLTSGNLTLTSGNLSVAGTGSFTGEVTVPTATVGTSAPNLAQVELLVAGVGVFQGSYNADTNTPALEGGSNVALDQGDYFVVSAGGDITFSDAVVSVEVGDFIFANASIAAGGGVGTGPASTDYTIVIADANLATAGTLNGATAAQRGVAGFDQDYFTVTTGTDAGFVSLVPTKNPYGATQTLDNGGSVATPTSPVVRVYDASTGLTTFTINLAQVSATGLFPTLFGPGALAKNVTAQVTQDAAPFQTVYADVTRSGSASMDIIFTGDVAVDLYRVLLTHI